MERNSDGAGYWPGFVGALTNVLSALVFVIVILTALASLLGRLTASLKADEIVKSMEATRIRLGKSGLNSGSEPRGVSGRDQHAGPVPEKPESVQAMRRPVELEFEGGAITLDRAATRQLDAALPQDHGRLQFESVRLTVAASRFSEVRRLGFLRAISVRNYLLERGMRPEQIAINVSEDQGIDADRAGKTVALEFQPSPSPLR